MIPDFSRRSLGVALLSVGALLFVGGISSWLVFGDDTSASDITSSVETTLGEPTWTSSTSSSTTMPTVTTASPTSPTTIDAAAEIEDFVEEFARAIETGDEDFLYERLHPSVLEIFSETSCRSFIGEEIMLLIDYRLVGQVEGPSEEALANMSVPMFRAPVAFSIQDQEFRSEAAFAVVGDEVRWFTQCGE